MQFLARDSMLYRAICYRPPVRLSVTRVNQSKTVKVRMQLSPQSCPMTHG